MITASMTTGEIGNMRKMSTTGMPSMPPHVSIVFKELFEELRLTKRQQWIMTNYCVLILAAIYTVLLPQFPQLSLMLKYAAFAVAIVGSALLLRMQWHMARSRKRLEKLHRTYFAENDLRGIGLTDKEIKKIIFGDKTVRARFAQFGRGWEFLITLIAVLCVGALLVWLKP